MMWIIEQCAYNDGWRATQVLVCDGFAEGVWRDKRFAWKDEIILDHESDDVKLIVTTKMMWRMRKVYTSGPCSSCGPVS